ncbi:MAG: hypothetical protein GSR84_08370 [Desulfurococcales archaeon]|nr:hypothetical protein [Desulfurococcales archaeon]
MLELKLSRISTLGIALSVVLVIPGLLAAPRLATLHMGLVGLGAGLLFPTAMYITFTGSLKSGLPRRGVEAAVPLASVLLAAASLPLYLAGHPGWRASAVGGLLFLALHSWLQARGWRRREPWFVLLYPSLAGAAGLACGCGVVESMLRVGLFYAAPMVVVVSLLTVSRNYGVDPSRPWVYSPLALNAVSLVLAVAGYSWYPVVSGLGLLLYFAVLRVWRAPSLVARGLRIGGPGGGALVYMGVSHLSSLASQLLWLASLDVLSMVHVVYIGFVGVHIFLHAPLMLPQVVRVRLAKVYVPPLPPILLAMAAVARPWLPGMSYALMVASLILLLVQFRPLGLVGRG